MSLITLSYNYEKLSFHRRTKFNLGTKEEGWKVDLGKFRIYLKDKYKVSEAYYYLGHVRDDLATQKLYTEIQKSGFILVFKDHTGEMLAKKKGNVDTDIVFEIMKNLVDNIEFDKILLVSGDGDYSKMVEYLISKERFVKILFPNKKFASSLYKRLTVQYFDYLSNQEVKHKIEYKSQNQMKKRT